MEIYKEIERSIITKYRKDIYRKFIKAIKDYELILPNDKIMVCISGGKDSFLMAKCIEEVCKHGNTSFEAIYVVMNPGYSKSHLNQIKVNAKNLNLKIEIFDSPIFEIVNNNVLKSPCYLCARMRRGYLYNYAKEKGFNKIALGHHFDDFIETSLLSMFYSSEIKTMMPKLHSDNFEGLELIRPMCLVKEKHIINWAQSNNLNFINCACRFTENNNLNNIHSNKRLEIKELINNLKKMNPEVDDNIYKSLTNVNLNCILGWHKNNKKSTFLDEYTKNNLHK